MRSRVALAVGLCVCLALSILLAQTASAVIIPGPEQFRWFGADEKYAKTVGSASQGDKALQTGLALLKKNRYGEAASSFWRAISLYQKSSVLKTHPKVSLAYYYLGKVYILSGKPDLARGMLQMAFFTYPTGQFLKAQVELEHCREDAAKQRLRNFALQRQLQPEALSLPSSALPEWEETIPMDSLFEFNSFVLKPDAMSILEPVVKRVRESGRTRLVAEAHSDNVGGQSYNAWLCQKRAAAVKDALVKLGLAKDKIKTVSFGQLLPVASNQTERGRYLNRRLVVKAIKQ